MRTCAFLYSVSAEERFSAVRTFFIALLKCDRTVRLRALASRLVRTLFFALLILGIAMFSKLNSNVNNRVRIILETANPINE